MSQRLDDLYFEWLYVQVGSVKLKNPSRTYWSLLRQLHSKEFVWFVPNDDNRVEDGRDLRQEYLDLAAIDPDQVDEAWMYLGCSVLEMLIGLSRRLSFEAEGEPREWFWKLIDNLGLTVCNDKRYPNVGEQVTYVVDTLIWRTYQRNGVGGLFPLDHPRKDQRKTEIWYQMNEYLLEIS